MRACRRVSPPFGCVLAPGSAPSNERCGEVPKAIVVLRETLTAEEVMAWLEPKVAHYKCLREVAFVDAIPKSPSGKILRRVLVEKERLARA